MSTKSTTGGVSGLSLLGIAFVVLRLCEVIDWSWWWVLLPFYGPLAVALCFIAGCLIFAVIATGVKK